MTSALAKLLRQSISNDREQITVAEEIDYVRSYLTIQKMRYKDKLEYTIDVEERILDVWIIKFVLQPLVENAIYHGLNIKRPKEIWIFAVTEEAIVSVWSLQMTGPEWKSRNWNIFWRKKRKRPSQMG